MPDAGFDKRTTARAREYLYQCALTMLPKLADYQIEHQWSGLRPGAPDGLAFIGAVPGVDGFYVNAGHYRNGLVLAPAAARLLVDQLLDRPPIIDPTSFRPDTLGLSGSSDRADAISSV